MQSAGAFRLLVVGHISWVGFFIILPTVYDVFTSWAETNLALAILNLAVPMGGFFFVA